jgi:hypothetical protein
MFRCRAVRKDFEIHWPAKYRKYANKMHRKIDGRRSVLSKTIDFGIDCLNTRRVYEVNEIVLSDTSQVNISNIDKTGRRLYVGSIAVYILVLEQFFFPPGHRRPPEQRRAPAVRAGASGLWVGRQGDRAPASRSGLIRECRFPDDAQSAA